MNIVMEYVRTSSFIFIFKKLLWKFAKVCHIALASSKITRLFLKYVKYEIASKLID